VLSAIEVSLDTKVNRGVAWAAGAQAIIAIADLVSQLLVVALWVSPEDYGIAFAAIPFYTALDYIADLGVSSALIQRDDHTPERVSTVFWFNVLISLGLFGVLLVLGPLYGQFQHEAVVGWLLVAYGGKLLLQNVYAIPFALLRKELRFSEIAGARIVAHLSESAARIVFAAMGATVWCWTFAALVRAAVFGIAVQSRHPFLPRLVFRPREVWPFIRFGLRTAASNLLYQLYTSMDAPIIFHFFGKQAAGIYGLADSIVLEPVKTIANVVIDVAFPAFARLRADSKAVTAQLIRFTRLNLIAVLPFVGLILLVAPEFLHLFYSGGRWTDRDLELCATCARILCVMGLFRALGFLGPPLLDGIGKPELTLRYMIIATIAVPGSFVLGAELLAGQFASDARFLSVAVAWGVGYPLAFAALAYLVVRTIGLPMREYIARSTGIIATCGVGIACGFGARYLLASEGEALRMVVASVTLVVVTAALLAWWQKITPRSIVSALRG
jgi:teichuronic acid exporter